MYPRIADYISLLYANFFHVLINILLLLPNRVACFFQNLFCLAIRSRARFYWSSDLQLFYAQENDRRMYFANMGRGFDCYTLGLNKRGQSIQDSYLLHKIVFSFNDTIIDCGANCGDLFIGLEDKVKPANYYCIEPAPDEYRGLRTSWPTSNHRQLGLAEISGDKEFYIASGSADSSIIEPEFFEKLIKIQTITLDEFIRIEGIKRCKLFKLEAEGYEYEVLLGAKVFLRNCEYVAVDGGAERGVSREQTLPAVTNLEEGYELIGLYENQCRALFRNKAYESA